MRNKVGIELILEVVSPARWHISSDHETDSLDIHATPSSPMLLQATDTSLVEAAAK
jgi:hypothetical protein